MIISLDIGASTTKGILVNEDLKIIDKHMVQTGEPKDTALKVFNLLTGRFKVDYKDVIRVIAASGGGSRLIGDEISGFPVKRVDEIKSIGLGGLYLAGKSEGLIVSAGTGTAVVAAYERGKIIKHVGGTGVGGGTIMGLSRRMLNVTDFGVMEDMALRGKTEKVDLTVADIVGGPVGIIPAEATASNFGKLSCESDADDIAAGIFNMVSQTIGVVAAMAARAYKLEDCVIMVGRLVKSGIVSKIIYETAEIFGVKIFIPEDCEFSNALGAAASAIQTLNLQGQNGK